GWWRPEAQPGRGHATKGAGPGAARRQTRGTQRGSWVGGGPPRPRRPARRRTGPPGPRRAWIHPGQGPRSAFRPPVAGADRRPRGPILTQPRIRDEKAGQVARITPSPAIPVWRGPRFFERAPRRDAPPP